MELFFRAVRCPGSVAFYSAVIGALMLAVSANQVRAEETLPEGIAVTPVSTPVLAKGLEAAAIAPPSMPPAPVTPQSTPVTLASIPIASPEPEVVSTGMSLHEWRAEQATTTQTSTNTLEQVQVSIDNLAQVNSITQFSDVRPSDWAYDALQFLVESYDCLEGYPDQSFRGNRPLSRYEFAASVAACLDSLNGSVNSEDIPRVQRLQTEFATELAQLRTRVDALEAQVAELNANQFSTTTRLFGQSVFGLQGHTENDFQFFVDTLTDNENQINLISNIQLSLLTQFDQRSLLLAGLQAGDGRSIDNGPALTNFFRLGYEGDTDNDVRLSDLTYRQLIGNNLALIVGPRGVNATNVFRGTNRVEGAGSGPLSRFAQRNPIIGIGNGTGGFGFDWQVTPRISLQGVYAASQPEDARFGVFGGDQGETAFGAQLVVTPFDNLDISLQYVNAYSPFGRLGTGVGDDQVAILGGNFRAPINTNALGTSVAWQASPEVSLGGWFGFTDSQFVGGSGSVETINWMVFLNVADLFGDGNLAGLYVGQPPRIVSSDLPAGRNVPSFLNEGDINAGEGAQPDAATHVELFYRWRVSDNIILTPGFIVVFDPGHNSNNDTIFVGALRTTFLF